MNKALEMNFFGSSWTSSGILKEISPLLKADATTSLWIISSSF